MGKPTGFIEYLREVAAEVSPGDRVGNWDEFHLHMPEEKLRTQAFKGSATIPSKKSASRQSARSQAYPEH